MAKAKITNNPIVTLELTMLETNMLRALLGATCGTSDEVGNLYTALDEVCPTPFGFRVTGSPRVDGADRG